MNWFFMGVVCLVTPKHNESPEGHRRSFHGLQPRIFHVDQLKTSPLLCTNQQPITMPLKIVRKRAPLDLKSLLPEHEITANDFEDGWSNFKDRFGLDPANGPLYSGTTPIIWKEIEDLIKTIDSEDHAMITVYHGLRGNTIVHGLRAIHVLNGTISNSLWDLDTLPTHEVLSNGSLKLIVPSDNWAALQAAYFSDMRVIRAGKMLPDSLNSQYDPKAVTFPWKDELRKMYDENRALVPSYEDFRVVITDYSIYHRDFPGIARGYDGPNGFRHAVCFHTQRSLDEGNTWKDMLDEDSHTLPYEYRGTNLGHLCPPRCKKTNATGKREP